MKTYFRSSLYASLLIIIFISTFNLSPFTAFAATTSTTVTAGYATAADSPAYIYIPSINLFSSVQGVGINKVGNMDVPSGHTANVGWYKYGVLPGNTGTAVLDAHN